MGREAAGMALVTRVTALVLLAGLANSACAQDATTAPAEAQAPEEAPEAPAKAEGSSFKLEDLAWQKGPVRIVPFGVGIFNVNYDTRSLFPGSFALYAQPNNAFNRNQFEMSPQNSFLGVDITGPPIGEAKTSGRIDFDFRGPSPVQNNATPYFLDIYGEIKTERWRFLVGQAHDVISPLDPPVLNFTIGPIGYMPGDIGFFRAQAQLDLYCPLSDTVQLNWQGSLNQQVIQTLQTATDLFGTDAGWPDVESRLALALGPLLEGTTRPVEVGVSAHIGERLLEDQTNQLVRHYRTWSLNCDLTAQLFEGTTIQGEGFMGAVLGSYNGAIFQGIDPIRLTAIRAMGGWLSLEQKFTPEVRGHLGVGIDDANHNDLSPGLRSRNMAYWGNVMWNITQQLTWGMEVSWWQTEYLAAPTNSAVRIETTLLYKF
jgi:hypothetical protein